MFDSHYVGMDVVSAENNGKYKPISRVTLMLDDGNALTSGDDTGRELIADCPHATQEMLDNLLASLKGHIYQAFEAKAANINPAAERGDAATVDGMYGVIAQIDDDGSGYVGLSAPGEAELEDEYPAAGPITREFNRQIASTRSAITKTAEQIRFEVSKEYTTKDELGQEKKTLESSITQSADTIKSEVSGTYLTKTDAANTYETKTNVSAISQKVDSIKLSVSNGEKSSTIKLMAGSTQISSEEIKFTGNVIFASDLGATGTTVVYGGRIATGTITADKIATGAITSEKILLFGEMTIYDSPDEDRSEGGSIGYYTGYATNASGDLEETLGVGMEVSSTQGRIMCSTDGVWCGFGKRSGISAYRSGVTITSNNGNGEIAMIGTVKDSSGTVITSDARLKRDINYDVTALKNILLNAKICTYRRTEGTRLHAGVIAQELEQVRDSAGVSDEDYAALCIDKDGYYGVRYLEWVPVLVAMAQDCEKRLNRLEGKR